MSYSIMISISHCQNQLPWLQVLDNKGLIYPSTQLLMMKETTTSEQLSEAQE
jgi:hypothetical protein